MDIEEYIAVLIVAAVTALITSFGVDQTTLRHCATRGQASMTGGGTIECTVKKENK